MGNLLKFRKNRPKMNKFAFILAILSVSVMLTMVQSAHPGCKYAVAKKGRCGAKFRARCPLKQSCSKWGWCGTSALHKKTAQKLFNGRRCKAVKKRVAQENQEDHQKGKKVVKKGKFSRWCKLRVTKNGRCGRKFKNTRCASRGQYCSRWGWCGRSSLHRRTSTKRFNGRRCGKVVKRTVRRKKAIKKVMKRISFRFKKGKKMVARWALMTMRFMKKARAAWRARRAAWRMTRKARRWPKAKRVVVWRRYRIYRVRHAKAARRLRVHKLRVRRHYRRMRLRMRKIRVSWRVARRVARKSKYARRPERDPSEESESSSPREEF